MQTTTTRSEPASAASDSPAARARWFRAVPDDGFFTLLLLALIVYITVLSIQSVDPPWAPGMSILTVTTTAGLALGYVSVQQGRLPSTLVHIAAVLLGMWLAFAQTADAVAGGDRGALWQHLQTWFQRAVLTNGNSTDNTVFLLMLAALTFLLAYTSVWLVLHTHRPWLAVLANTVVLLINLNLSTSDKYIFLLIFLLLALLLFVRFTLSENIRMWRARGIRFSPDLGWDFMQAGAIFAVLVLLLAYLLPVGTANTNLQAYLTSPQNPWQQFQGRFSQLFGGVNGGTGGGTVAFFNSTLRLTGSVDLPNVPILHYTTSSGGDANQYLMTESFDTYDGTGTWSSSNSHIDRVAANTALPSATTNATKDTYTITFNTVPPGGQSYIFAPGDEPASFSVPTTVQTAQISSEPVAWTAQSALTAGHPYTATGYVAIATAAQLKSVPFPNPANTSQDAPYPPSVLNEYLQGDNSNIPAAVASAARVASKGTSTMYDAAVSLEDYLRTFTYSTTNPSPPYNVDATTFFLQTKRGFCTDFASAMALMGRSLGMPTRIVSGFTSGTYDDKAHDFIVRGTQAHTWTQIYFGTYGWINFEPTASFGKFSRAATGSTSTNPNSTDPNASTTTKKINPDATLPNSGGGAPGAGHHTTSPLVAAGIGATTTILLVLLAAAIALLWWRRLYRGISPAATAFARVTRLGGWAGAPPQPAQTPLEYADRLGAIVPEQRSAIHRLSDVYARERWGGASHDDDDVELTRLYDQTRVALSAVIVQRLRYAPHAGVQALRRRLHRQSGTPGA